jgi:microcystin-dependent protein
MSEIVEDLKLSTLEITTGLGINFSATDGYISHHGEGDFVIESEISPIVIKTDAGCSGNGNIYIESSHNGCDAILMTANHGYINSFSQGQFNIVGSDGFFPFNQNTESLLPQNSNLLQNIKSNAVKNIISKSAYGEKVFTNLTQSQNLNPNNLNPNNLNPSCENSEPVGVMINGASNFIGIFSEGQESIENGESIVIEAYNGEIVITTDGVTNNADILIHANGDINLDVDQEYHNIVLTTTDTGVVVAPGKFEAGTVFQEYQPTTNPASYGLLVPTGAVMPYAGPLAPATAPPAGWLFCNGASLSRTTYSILFAIIGTTYGSVSGTHFNLPDLRSRFPLGAGAGAGLTPRDLADIGGQESITDVPQHTHNLNNATSVVRATGGGDLIDTAGTGGIDGGNSVSDITVGITGSVSVNVMNPFLVLNYIIKV